MWFTHDGAKKDWEINEIGDTESMKWRYTCLIQNNLNGNKF
jgi:hypothetical protein